MGNLVLYADMKAFKLKEDISIFSDEQKTTELLRIKARSIIDWSAAYDVFDSQTGDKIGALRRRGFKSILKDEWIILDNSDNEIGRIAEDNWLKATLRRFLTNLIPQTYNGSIGTAPVLQFRQRFGLGFIFGVLNMTLDFTPDMMNRLDRRMGIACAVLLAAIEGRQSD